MFSYCLNNPISYMDTQGHIAVENGDTEDDPLRNGIDDFTNGNKQENTDSKTANASRGGRAGFRGKLQKLTGQSGKDSDAHHVFPVKFEDLFKALGIDIHNPAYGAWWESSAHHQNSYEYNSWWGVFFSIKGVTSADAFALADFLAEFFGFDTNY